MFLYGAVMLVVAFIFAIMSYFYTYSDFSGNVVEPIDDGDTEMKEKQKKTSHDSTTHL